MRSGARTTRKRGMLGGGLGLPLLVLITVGTNAGGKLAGIPGADRVRGMSRTTFELALDVVASL